MKIAHLLDDRVVHWGDNATLRSGRKKVVGVIERTAQEVFHFSFFTFHFSLG